VSYDPQDPARPVNYVAGVPVSPPQQGVSPYPYYAQPPLVRPTSGLAVAALICGLVGLVPCFFAMPSIAAVILGHLALKETANGVRPGHGQAVAGLILGYVVVGLGALYIVLLIIGAGVGGLNQYNN
jgi:hypothetical protein